MADFADIFSDLEGVGVYEIALPFLLVFTVIFGALNKANIFGNKKFDGVIALVVAFLIVREDVFISFMNDILSRFSVLIVVVVAFLIIFGIFGAGTGTFTKGLMTVLIVGSLIVGVYILFEMMDEHGITDGTDIDDWWDEHWETVMIVIFVILVFWLLISSTGDAERGFGKAIGSINDAWGVPRQGGSP